MQRFGDPKVQLHPDAIDNSTMGTIFEELIRKFNEALERESRRALHPPATRRPSDGRSAPSR